MKNVILTFFITGLILISQNLYAQINLDSGCVANYPFNGNAEDISGNGNNGTVYGATLTTDRFGYSNSAYSFNGVNNYISVPNNGILNFGTATSFTLCAWIKCSVNQNNYDGILAKCLSNNPSRGYQLCFYQNKICCELWYGTIPPLTITGNIVVNNNAWRFITLVVNRQNNNIKIYVDGNVDKDITLGVLFGQNLSCSSNMLMAVDRANNLFYNGIIDDIRIYNRTLSQAEISALYNILNAPTLISPANNSTNVSLTPTLIWNSLPGAIHYTVQVSPLSNFSYIVDSATVTTNQRTIPAGKLNVASTYFWRVRGVNSFGNGPWSDVWSFSTLITNMQKLNSEIPREYKLHSNHPNPFNPVTNIKFDIPKSSFVKMIIYNSLGRKVTTLVCEKLNTGRYEVAAPTSQSEGHAIRAIEISPST